MHVHSHRARRVLGAVVLLAVSTAVGLAACAEIGTSPEEPAAIEMVPFAWPSVVAGDTLRDADGVVAPIRANVRNVSGDIIADAPVRYLYADFNRDSALHVDSLTGIVVALKPITSDARLAARIGGALQVLRPITVTARPDTMEGEAPATALRIRYGESVTNRTEAFRITLRNLDSANAPRVKGWVVQYRLIAPSNPGNDTTAAAWLVDDRGVRSATDTTDGQGSASRYVRVRAGQFPATQIEDSIEVEVVARYRGQDVRGAPLRLKAAVVDSTRP